jgi:pimeloyl-ACP methyl ester carboxylesterase
MHQPETSKFSIHPIKQCQVEDLNYAYIDKGEGPVIIFLHGFPDLAGTWDETISHFSANYRCIAPFLRGYYPTDLSKDNNYSTTAIATDIFKLTQKLNIESYYLVGHDWGAATSYALANLAPNAVIKLATIAVAHPRCLKPSLKLALAARHFFRFRNKEKALKLTRKKNFAYIDKLVRRWSPDWKDYKKSTTLLKETLELPGRLEACLGYYWSFFDNFGNKEIQKANYQVPQIPIHFFYGTNEKGVTKKVVKAMSKYADITAYKKAGHFLHHEVSEKFLKDLSSFLRS